jgi:5-methylthioadenosine/S-adenosylhomocysteine deaminase
VLTHVYETKAQAAKARVLYGEQGGSMLRWLDEVGLLNERLTIVHGVWLIEDEIAMLGRAGAGLAHNSASNLKLKSGVAPMRRVIEAGVNVALGCDNCSCSDCQSIFAAMKLLCLLGVRGQPDRRARHERTRGSDHEARKPLAWTRSWEPWGPACDLADIAYVPLKSGVRQIVFAESGRRVHSVIVGGELVLDAGRITAVDETAPLREAEALMPTFRRDNAVQTAQAAVAVRWHLQANGRVSAHELGLDRFIPG